MPSWADDVPEPAAQQSGGRRGPPSPAAAEAPRRSVLDRLGPAAAPAASTGVPAPRAAPRPQPREGKGRGGAGGSAAPDFGPDIDWRLSRVSLADDEGPKNSRRARGGLPEASGRRVVTVTPEGAAPDPGALPARLVGRVVLPGLPSAPPQVASPPSRRKSPPPPREAAAAAAAKTGGTTSPLVVHVGPRGDRVVERATASPPVIKPAAPKPAAPKPGPMAGALPAPKPGWNFRDKRGNVQGPHSAGELVAWYAAGYYAADLPVQRVGEAWTTLRAALPELKAATASAAPKAVAAVPAASAEAKPAAAAPSPAATRSASGAQDEPAGGAALASAASVWSTEETVSAKRMFDKLGTLWMYIDPSGERQGPFGGHDMATWFMGGYMEDRELLVANVTTREPGDADFSPLAGLLKPADTVYASCNAQAAPALTLAVASMSISGYTNLTRPQWTGVSSADANCISTVSSAMLALVGNAAVVPAAYQSILTTQMTAMFSQPCPLWNVTLAAVQNISAFNAAILSYSLASATSTTVVARMSNYIVSASTTVNITGLLPLLAAAPASAATLVANVTTALAFSLGVSPAQLTLGAINVAPLLTVAYNVSCGGTNSTYAAALVSRASGLSSSPILTYALSLLSLPPATVTAAPTVYVVGTLQLTSLNSTLIAPAVVITKAALQQFYPGSTMVSLVSPPLNMQAVVQSALAATIMASCASASQVPLFSTLQTMQAGGLSSMSCAQWSAVAMEDTSCLSNVRTTMLGLITAVVPNAYKTAMTAQTTALFTCACPLYNVTLAQLDLSTFSVPALTAMLAAIMPSNTSASVQVRDFAVSAQVVLSSIPSSLSAAALVPAFVAALAASLGVDASTVALGTVVPGRRLLSQLTVPFTFSSLGANVSVVASKVALVSALSSPTSALSLGLAQVGVPPVTLVAPPWVSATGTVQVLGTSGSNLTAAASVLAAALPSRFPGSTFVAAVAPPAAPPAPLPLVINNAGADPSTFAALYSTMLAAQCSAISSPGVLDAASALLGTPHVACSPALPSAPPTSMIALPPAPSEQSNVTNQTVVLVTAVESAASKLAAALPFLMSVVLLLAQ